MGFLEDNLVSFVNGLAIGFLLFILAVGLSLVFGLMDVLNLAHGALFLLGAYIGFQIAPDGGALRWVVAIGVALAVGLVLGGVLAGMSRPLTGRGHLDQALLTLGVAFVLTDVAALIWGNDDRSLASPDVLSGPVTVAGQTFPLYRLALIVVGAVLAAVVYYAFEKTQLGAIVRAAVADRSMVDALGVNTNRVLLGVFGVGAAMATFAGILGAPVLGVSPGVDDRVLLLALITVVIGGLGSIRGALVAALLIGQIDTTGVALLGRVGYAGFSGFLLFGAMAAVLLLRPEGLFGTSSA